VLTKKPTHLKPETKKRMAQVDFFLCIDEKIEIANMLFSSGLTMIPDIPYDSEEYITISSVEAYLQYASANILIFIIDSDKANSNSMVFGSLEKNDKTSFFVRQRYGVPTIDYYSPGMIEKTEKKIGPGFFGNYAFYYDKKGEKIYPSEKDTHVFKTISSFVKKRTTPVKLTKRTYWIGNISINLCKEQGYELVKIGDKDLISLL
jgi:hypothetical protein